jgi:putative spermidine/putrescine transport system permease protein
MYRTRRLKLLLRLLTGLVLVFVYLPLAVIALQAFNADRRGVWPIDSFTLHWVRRAADNDGLRSAIVTSVEVGLAATAIALVLGTLASIGVHRFRFFGRDAISLLVVLPIALPGIVTGVALNASITEILGVSLALWTIVVAHSTFCIVVVYNNVVARLRRTSRNLEEASADLGGDPGQTFRYVTFPLLRSALLAGGLLAFALSFDEIVVTNFTAGGQVTVPIWIFSNLFRPANAPLVNVAALLLVLLSVIPVWFAQRLAGEAGSATGGAR